MRHMPTKTSPFIGSGSRKVWAISTWGIPDPSICCFGSAFLRQMPMAFFSKRRGRQRCLILDLLPSKLWRRLHWIVVDVWSFLPIRTPLSVPLIVPKRFFTPVAFQSSLWSRESKLESLRRDLHVLEEFCTCFSFLETFLAVSRQVVDLSQPPVSRELADVTSSWDECFSKKKCLQVTSRRFRSSDFSWWEVRT